MTTALALEVRKVRRSFCVCAGVSVLARFRTEAQALASLEDNRAVYGYWADSAAVLIENTPARVIYA